jgi:hypothetical protein
MPLHTTNYTSTFIAVAEDCPAPAGEIPPVKGDAKTIAGRQFELISQHPYRFTSDDVLFRIFAERNDLAKTAYAAAREIFFSKGQPCFRASPLTKRYGWGVHSDAAGKIAVYGVETDAYRKLAADKNLTVVKAMRSGK